MANSITTIFTQNGSRNFVAKIDIVCDTATDYTNATVIDVANLTGTPSKFKVRNIVWQLSNFSCNLLWDATTKVQAVALNQYEGDLDLFCDGGGPLVNNAGDGVTGKLLITTKGIAAGSTGTIIIRGYH